MSGEESEFGTTATWTVEAVRAIGDDHAVPAACRGSGGPGALEWFADLLDLRAGRPLLDVGAGMGGPCAWARATTGAVPVLVEPMAEACRAAAELFGLPAAVGAAEHLPVADGSVERAWSLGVLCTTSDQPAAVRELARVLAPGGRAGLLVYVRRVADLDREPETNHFPARDELDGLVAAAGLEVADEVPLSDLPDPPDDWRDRETAVDDHIEAAHGDTDAWRDADRDETAVAQLLETGQVTGLLLALHR